MAEIEIQSVEKGKLDGVTMDGNPMPDYPVLYVRYDPPWDPKMEDHVHVVPLMAIADIQMTHDLDSPHAALEHCLLTHTADTMMSLKNWDEFQQFTGENANRMKEKWAATQDFLIEEAETVEVTSKEEMKESVRSLALPGGVQKRMRMMGLRAPQGAMATLVEKHDSLMTVLEEHKAPHSLKTETDGFQQAAAILDAETDKIEQFKDHIYKLRYAKRVDVVVEERERKHRRQKDLEKTKNIPPVKAAKHRDSEEQTLDTGKDSSGPADRPNATEPPRRPQV